MLSPGDRLGPYEVLSPLGAGGMGEVYRARDPRLGREVAVKVIRDGGEASPERRRRFEDEARAVATLSHPNVLTVHDVGVHEGQPYLVLELLEGETLRSSLRRTTLTPRRALEVAIDVGRGLEAAHARGLVHRDLKPENVFLQGNGAAKILDFGLARLTGGDAGPVAGATATPTVPGAIVGTVGYMSPEQVRGLAADARSDIFALGAVLYEMLAGRRAFSGRTPADTLAAVIASDPPPLASGSGPLPPGIERVVRRCLAKEPEERFHSAHDLALALESLLERTGLAAFPDPDRGPYPGLASFQEQDASRFFGREKEAEALWEKLECRTLLAVIGPSGAGKTSFVRAGVAASRPPRWGVVVTTPGIAPLVMLGQVLAPEVASDGEALRQLVRFDDPEVAYGVLLRWRAAHERTLLVVDQFEELFTLNPPPVQERFAALLGRLAGEAGVHVLLSMRDDFLMRCEGHEGLLSVFSELTPLGPLVGTALRRSLEEPAKAEGYRFEDGLLDEMTGAVEGERGALPLLAFAVSRLWEKRDRERRLLTHQAHAEIGGVSGALARHAEATLDRIGRERQGVVREILRNLVTSQGTRAVVDRDELLSVFPDPAAAAQVLDQLVAARLLTSFDAGPSPSSAGVRRVEIVHESLLRSWLRLVRWQAQDAEGALLRDQLRQAAHLWSEKGRPEDLLWAGASYLEYRAWRERYAGGLSAVEEDFARAMTALAGRRRRRRRAAAVAALVLATGAALVTSALWRRSETARAKAETEARRAEASKLLALGQNTLGEHPSAALAYAIRSLELADTREGRLAAVRAIQQGPTAFVWDAYKDNRLDVQVPSFSASGERLAIGGFSGVQVLGREGGPPVHLERFPNRGLGSGGFVAAELDAGGRVLVTLRGENVRAFSIPERRELWSGRIGEGPSWPLMRDEALFTVEGVDAGGGKRRWLLRRWDVASGRSQLVGASEGPGNVDPAGRLYAFQVGRRVLLRPLDRWDASRVLGEHAADVEFLVLDPAGQAVAARDASGEVLLWPTGGASTRTSTALSLGREWRRPGLRPERTLAARHRERARPRGRVPPGPARSFLHEAPRPQEAERGLVGRRLPPGRPLAGHDPPEPGDAVVAGRTVGAGVREPRPDPGVRLRAGRRDPGRDPGRRPAALACHARARRAAGRPEGRPAPLHGRDRARPAARPPRGLAPRALGPARGRRPPRGRGFLPEREPGGLRPGAGRAAPGRRPPPCPHRGTSAPRVEPRDGRVACRGADSRIGPHGRGNGLEPGLPGRPERRRERQPRGAPRLRPRARHAPRGVPDAQRTHGREPPTGLRDRLGDERPDRPVRVRTQRPRAVRPRPRRGDPARPPR